MPETTNRQRNWAPWFGLLLALVALLSNAGFFLGLPGQRAIAWLSVALAIAALVCAAVGIMRAFRQPQVYGGKVSSSILGVVSLLICGFAALISVQAQRFEFVADLLVLALLQLHVAQVVERAALGRGHQPRGRVVGHAVFRPAFDRG